jgi:hypothetical protein
VIKLVDFAAWAQDLASSAGFSWQGAAILCSRSLSQHPVMGGWRSEQEAAWFDDAEANAGWGQALAEEAVFQLGSTGKVPALEVHPAYLRAPDAELKLRRKMGLSP